MGGRGVPLSAAQPAVRAAGPLEGGGRPRPAGAAGRSLRRRGGSRGCAAPPRGWARSGARAPPGLLLGGTADLPGRRRRRAARSRPALLTLPSVSLCGRDALRSGTIRAGARRGAAQRSPLTAPFRTHSPQVAEGGPAREPLQLLEVSPRKRLPAGPEQDPCGSRPAPEGAGAGAEQGHSAGGGGWCRHCHTKLAELKRQAWKLVSGPGTRLRVSGPSLLRLLRAGPALELGRLWVPEGVFLASPCSSLGLSFSVCKRVWVGAVHPNRVLLWDRRGLGRRFSRSCRCSTAGTAAWEGGGRERGS